MLYNHLLQAVVALLNTLAQSVLLLITIVGNDILPPFVVDRARFVDNEYVLYIFSSSHSNPTFRSAYELALEWLSFANSKGDAARIATDIQAHWDVGQGIYLFISFLTTGF